MLKERNEGQEKVSKGDSGSIELPAICDLLTSASIYKEYDLDGNYDYIKRIFTGPDIQFDTYCIFCKKESTFKQFVGSRGGGAGKSIPANYTYLRDQIFTLRFICQRNQKHIYWYALQVDQEKISKVGQTPSLADIATPEISRFSRVANRELLKEYKMAVGLFSHGVGAGSFVYLRRIFEKLISETAKKAAESGESFPDFESKRIFEKIEVLARHLPSDIVENKNIYKILSAGIHDLSEEECMLHFPVLKSTIDLILDEYITQQQIERDKVALKTAIGKTFEKIKSRDKR